MMQYLKEGWRPHGPGKCRCPRCGAITSTNALARARHVCKKPEQPKPVSRRYSIWKNVAFDGYDIELWENQTVTIVQTNIYTYEKAQRALADWKAREQEHREIPWWDEQV